MLEVEVKARATPGLRKKLVALGARKLKTESQVDTYFNSPMRDFAETDEALRVRRVGRKHHLTYKGPKLDSETKMREEIEMPVDPRICEVLEKLGFREVAVVRKRREVFLFRDLVICLDKVEGLGGFIEVEGRREADKSRIFSFLEDLGIDRRAGIRESYLELLLGRK